MNYLGFSGYGERMLDGLPLHPLFAHAPVVLLPLAAIGVIVLAVMRRRSAQLVYAVLGVLVVAVGSAGATLLSGNALASVMGFEPETHQRWGQAMTIGAVVFLLVAAPFLWLVARGGDSPRPLTKPLGYAASVVGVVVVALTYLAGHSGAQLAWSDVAASTTTPTATNRTYTLDEVAQHRTATDCWTVVDGRVYDLTEWVGRHPGGASAVTGMCGVDATAAYQGKHGGEQGPAEALSRYQIGTLASAATTSATPAATPSASASASATPAASTAAPSASASATTATFTLAQVAQHSTATDCWTVVDGKVYDLTEWVGRHPGGTRAVTGMCGVDATAAFQRAHAGEQGPADALARYQIGTLAA